MKRCQWPSENPLMIAYHDEEWGVPQRTDEHLFEYIVLDTFQAGLSWELMINKRENFRRAFKGFDAPKISKMTPKEVDILVTDASIIRHRGKIEATVSNAKLYLETQKEFGTFAKYLWQFTDNKVVQNNFTDMGQIPTTSVQAVEMSKDLKKRGFKFVGPTICYAFMQGIGMVNDHTTDCFRYDLLKG